MLLARSYHQAQCKCTNERRFLPTSYQHEIYAIGRALEVEEREPVKILEGAKTTVRVIANESALL
jgi:hypothetical protein